MFNLTIKRYFTSDQTSKSSAYAEKVINASNSDIDRQLIVKVGESALSIEALKDKRIFIFTSFVHDHPSSKINNYEELLKLVSINKNINDWYSDVSREYSVITTAPEWLKEDPKLLSIWESNYSENLLLYKQRMKEFREQEVKARDEFEAVISKIHINKETYIESFIRNNPIAAVDKIVSQSLPYELVENVTTMGDDEASEETKKILKKFKRDLISKIYSEDDNFNVEDLIEELKKLL